MILKVWILSFLSIVLSRELKIRILNTYLDLKPYEYKITSDLGSKNSDILGLYSKKYISIDAEKYLVLNVLSSELQMNITDDKMDACTILIAIDSSSFITIRLKYDNLNEIKMADRARWSIINLSENLVNLTIYTQNSICFGCAFIKTGELAYGSDLSNLENDTIHDFQLKIQDSREFSKTLILDIEQNGIYTYIITDIPNNDISLIKIIEVEPKNTWAPLLVFFSILIFLCIMRLVINHLLEKRKNSKEKDESLLLKRVILPETEADRSSSRPVKKPERSRVESLDTFRGMALAIMIFVNYGGGNYWFFQHSDWNGLTFADLVFPWFIWIMGTSMALSFDKLAKNKTNHFDYIYKIFRRSVLLFLIGLIFINNGYDLGAWRVPGVLQRFAFSYFFIAIIVSYVPLINYDSLTKFKDILPFLYQWFSVMLILLLYIILTYVLQFENCPRGYTGAGGLADDGRYPDCTGGSALFIDKAIFGYNHIFHAPTSQRFYKSKTFDPEGFLGNLTSVVLTFIGYQAGRILISYKEDLDKIIRWIIWGLILLALGLGLGLGGEDQGLIPINKNLWSISFIFLLSGMAFIILAFFYILVDIKKWWLGWPVIYVGRNSIAIYVCHEVFEKYFPFEFRNCGSHEMKLLENGVGVICWLWVAWKMNQEKIFVKV